MRGAGQVKVSPYERGGGGGEGQVLAMLKYEEGGGALRFWGSLF